MAKRGLKTDAGKAVASRNSLKHGLTSEANVIPGMESEAEWEARLAGVFESLNPEDHFQEILAERIASLTWRLDRVVRYELAVTTKNIESADVNLAAAARYGAALYGEEPPEDLDPGDLNLARQRSILPKKEQLEHIIRYEAHLHRQLLQTLHELEAIQARRKGQPSHLARLDVSFSPTT